MKIDTHETALPRQATDRTVFALGDIHGRLDLLEAALVIVAREKKRGDMLVFLGDLIDRGPDSLACVRTAMSALPGMERKFLCGNHEQMARGALATGLGDRHADGDLSWLWLANGGRAVIAEHEEGMQNGRWTPPSFFVEYLAGLEISWRSGNVLFVHAGVVPGVPLATQIDPAYALDFERVMRCGEGISPLWVRGPFLNWLKPFEDDVFVVHGHTIHESALVEGNRLCLDLGSYREGKVALARIDGSRLRIHTIQA